MTLNAAVAAPLVTAAHDERPRAHVIRSDDEALEVARRLAAQFAAEASARDRERRLPRAELDAYSQSGLWAITVPREYGGADVSYVTVAEVFRLISAADPSIGQIAQNHFSDIDTLRWSGTEAQKQFLFGEALAGARFGNAQSEAKSRTVAQMQTTILRDGDHYRIDGRKFYATGALYAHWVQVYGVDDEGRDVVAFVERDARGLSVVDDWSAFGQRTTASGSVVLDGVRVPAARVIAAHRAYDRPTTNGPVAQILQAAIDAGIAAAALEDTQRFVRTQTRPWIDSGQQHGHEDVYTIAQIGDLQVRLHAAEALLERAGKAVDRAVASPGEETVAQASIAVAEAKILTTEVALQATNKLFELAGTKSTLAEFNLDRHWRNARTHTLHDPVRWKYHAVGNYYLNGINPPRHGWI